MFDEYYYAHDAAALLHGELGPRGRRAVAAGRGALARAPGTGHPAHGRQHRRVRRRPLGLAPAGGARRYAAGRAGVSRWHDGCGCRRCGRWPPRCSPPPTRCWSSSRVWRSSTSSWRWARRRASTARCAPRPPASGSWLWTALCGLAGGTAVGQQVVRGARRGGRPAALRPGRAQDRRQPARRRRRTSWSASRPPSTWPPTPATSPPATPSPTSCTCSATCSASTGSVRGTVSFASRPATWPLDVHPIWLQVRCRRARHERPHRHRQPAAVVAGASWRSWCSACRRWCGATCVSGSRRCWSPSCTCRGCSPRRQAYIYYMTPVVPFLAVLVATALWRLAPRPAPCPPQALGFGAGALLTGAAFGLAGLGEGAARIRRRRLVAPRGARRRRRPDGRRRRLVPAGAAEGRRRRRRRSGPRRRRLGLRRRRRRPRPGLAAVPARLPGRLRAVPAAHLVRHLEVRRRGAGPRTDGPPLSPRRATADRAPSAVRR